MNLISQTLTHEYYLGDFEGHTVRFVKNKRTGELKVNAEDLATILGYESLEQMMLDDKVLDLCNEVKEGTGVFPITKQNF